MLANKRDGTFHKVDFYIVPIHLSLYILNVHMQVELGINAHFVCWKSHALLHDIHLGRLSHWPYSTKSASETPIFLPNLIPNSV